jgi:hypothetical protein
MDKSVTEEVEKNTKAFAVLMLSLEGNPASLAKTCVSGVAKEAWEKLKNRYQPTDTELSQE